MTKRFEVMTDNFEISIKDKAVRDYPFSIQCENIDEFEPLLQEVMNVNARLNKIWEQTQRFDKYSQEHLQRANQLEKENEELKKALLFFYDVANCECSTNWKGDMEKGCKRFFNCTYEEAKEKYGNYDGMWWEIND